MKGHPSFSSAAIVAAVRAERVSGSRGEEVSGISIDTRTLQPGNLYVAIRGKRFDGHDFVAEAFARGAAAAVVDRWPLKQAIPVDGTIWRVPDTLRALGDLAQFHRRRFDLKAVAVTGSAGKTTVKTLLAHLFSGNVSGDEEVLATPGTQNNWVGVPLALLRLHERHRFAVLELGANRWGEVRRLTEMVRPTVGIITLIGPAHLEAFGDLEGVLRAKGELWEAMDPAGALALNADDPLLRKAGSRLERRIVWFGFDPKAEVRAAQVRLEPWGSRSLINDEWELKLSLPGVHNLTNALSALAAAQALGMELPRCVERLSTAPSLSGRLAKLEWNGCVVLDDSYNANPASLKAALEVFRGFPASGRRVVALGDMLELGAQAENLHAQAGKWLALGKVDFFVAVGPLARSALEAAWKAGLPKKAGRGFETSEEAGEFLLGWICPGDLILLKGSRGMQMEKLLKCSTTSSIH